ncbi:HET-domain-containing protein [Xylaria bambusicola]|uniref:HET-domain-containing protein n=1 Tax=Xylaria bambusicola TaxID=326684 RepID=UPI002007F569|nr:HET-domain-containing protein [Xylaria bambusicola]KAI0513093.1 HET-domain-containing protein [Xylaria bambusicola]
MRLLKVSSLTFREFFEPDVPKYAILSHTWEKEEVLFEDIHLKEQARSKIGYKKVVKACNLARSQGYKYIWIDTCCIDKSSSAELTEAINSMYRWYKESDVCYAFLSDVSGRDFEISAPDELRESRWFTRGWTLQELIAPDNVEFYGSDWQSIGNKKNDTLCSIIADITKIDEGVLRGKDIFDISIARRMYWASGRETTRIEDLAYSLLGIFDINMPLIYGEGHKAFRRLQEEILKTTDDQSIFAWYNYTLDGSPVDILAQSPSDFSESGRISPYTPFRVNRKATAITNQGIAVELPILSLPSPLHTEHSPFEEIEAILDCQLGSTPGTFPTIRLRSVERGGNRIQRHYYRIMGETTSVKENIDLDLLTKDVVGFDPTQLDQDLYKDARENLVWNCKIETIIITRRTPKPNQVDTAHIPWSLSLLASEYPPDDTPFWLALFCPSTLTVDIADIYPKQRWDKSLRQMRVSSIPQIQYGLGQVRRIEGAINLNVRFESSASSFAERITLILGRKSFDRRDSYLKPWCRIYKPQMDAAQIPDYVQNYNSLDRAVTQIFPSGELPESTPESTSIRISEIDPQVLLNVKVRIMEVSGRFYYIVNVVYSWDEDYYYGGMRLLE